MASTSEQNKTELREIFVQTRRTDITNEQMTDHCQTFSRSQTPYIYHETLPISLSLTIFVLVILISSSEIPHRLSSRHLS